MEPEVDNDLIQKLAAKISKIRNKKILINIVSIIKVLNPTLPITENGNGLFIKFNALESSTYIKLDNYLKKINSSKKTGTEDSIHVSEYIPYSSDEVDLLASKYKLSNKEKTIIKKQQYQDA